MEIFGFNQHNIMNKKSLVFIIVSSLLIVSACTKAETEFDSIRIIVSILPEVIWY